MSGRRRRKGIPDTESSLSGSRVSLHGLVMDTRYNGKVGTVSGYDKHRRRYFVDLDCAVGEVNVLRSNFRVLPSTAGKIQDVVHPGGILAPPIVANAAIVHQTNCCLLYTSPSPRDQRGSRMPSSA